MNRKFAFTLIEILIAITVFAIGVLAVFRVVIGNLKAMDDAEVKLQATILAKEGIELLYNIRDSNLEKELPWNCIIDENVYTTSQEDLKYDKICSGYFGVDKLLQLSFDNNFYISQSLVEKRNSFDELFDENKLCRFQESNFSWYGNCKKFVESSTYFARYLSFDYVYIGEPVSSTKTDVQDKNRFLSKDKILKVESHVLYDRGGKTGEVVFESFIGNY